jgi:GMP synthase-like glutamine amidotransferase
VNVLALIHGEQVRSGVFADAIRGAGHRLDEQSFLDGRPRLDGADAVIVLGGSMHPDQDDEHPWLPEETHVLRGLLEAGTPLLGVCLGAQMLARAAGGAVRPAAEPEIGWFDVEVTEPGDPLLGPLPPRFEAFQWHSYTYDLPPGAVEIARSPVCSQGFRLGARVWGVQFHPEVTAAQIESWLADPDDPAPDPERLRRETAERIEAWNELGRGLCRRFLAVCG